ncbi:MAG: DUF3786 domain-containing protein [Desulfobulbaceae bacterium]
MPPKKNPLQIYKCLPQTNCGECFLPSCLAFAAAVTSGAKNLADCPHLQADAARALTGNIIDREPYEIQREEHLTRLRQALAKRDLPAAAARLGARIVDEKVAVTCLGKDFFVDRQGRVTSECHTHYGLTIPLLTYLLDSKGDRPAGRWVPFRELQGGPPMTALFEQRGEKRLQHLADHHPDLYDDLVTIFSGKEEKKIFAADTAVVLRPLPRLPVLICYWRPEEDLGSKLNIFFDTTADKHLSIEMLFELTVGMVMMFEKIARKHI